MTALGDLSTELLHKQLGENKTSPWTSGRREEEALGYQGAILSRGEFCSYSYELFSNGVDRTRFSFFECQAQRQ